MSNKLRMLSATMLGAGLIVTGMPTAVASSHREAPFITQMPKVDGTDFYMFNSYESGRTGFVTMVANYVPLQDAYGGPNYFALDPAALYEIHVDNNGDAKEDVTFQFRFTNSLKDISLNVGGKTVAIPLINSGSIAAGNTTNLNTPESYTVNIVRGNRRTGTTQAVTNAVSGSATFAKPVDNIGAKSIPNYAAYAASHIYNINIPGCSVAGKMFVGQRKEPFVISLGKVFDLLNLNPLGPANGETNILNDKNVTSFVMEIPSSCLVANNDPVIGAWTTASVRQGQLFSATPSFQQPAKQGGAWTQVSRVSMPLVNEVVIGVKDKNKFNSSKPEGDAQFADYVTNPTFPALVTILFPTAPAPTLFPRSDLVATFLTGINTTATGNLNQPRNVVPAELMRLNTSIPPVPRGSQNTLGVIGGDNAGFPNGRRPGDDVVDVTLRVAMGKLISLGLYGTAAQAPAGNAALTDGAAISDLMFDAAFPYLTTPIPGSANQ